MLARKDVFCAQDHERHKRNASQQDLETRNSPCLTEPARVNLGRSEDIHQLKYIVMQGASINESDRATAKITALPRSIGAPRRNVVSFWTAVPDERNGANDQGTPDIEA